MSTLQSEGTLRQLLSAMRNPAPTRYAPLVGLLIGAVSGAVYWLAAQLWPSSIAVALSMLTSALLTSEISFAMAATTLQVLSQFFYLLIKYNVLMALSAAKRPFAAPPNVALGLIMACGYGAGRALYVSLMATQVRTSAARISTMDLVAALAIGFAPAVLLGIPGLTGLAVAIVSSLGMASYLKLRHTFLPSGSLLMAALLAELCFYLGAQASWSYV